MKFNTAEEAIDYLHRVTKQQEIRDETNKLMDRCYAKGSRDLMVFQRQKFLNELFPLLNRLDVVVRGKSHFYGSTELFEVESLIEEGE